MAQGNEQRHESTGTRVRNQVAPSKPRKRESSKRDAAAWVPLLKHQGQSGPVERIKAGKLGVTGSKPGDARCHKEEYIRNTGDTHSKGGSALRILESTTTPVQGKFTQPPQPKGRIHGSHP